MSRHLLIEKDFLVMFPGLDRVPKSPDAVWVGHGTLQKPAISTQNIVHAILRGTVEFCQRISILTAHAGPSG